MLSEPDVKLPDDWVIVISPGSVMSQAKAIAAEPLTVPVVTAAAGLAIKSDARRTRRGFTLV